ncbi:hypothetical protein KKG46_05055 [Patescibacteria group bacterium]|nr:hypothetical protein [Patescibacteria group bacterium]
MQVSACSALATGSSLLYEEQDDMAPKIIGTMTNNKNIMNFLRIASFLPDPGLGLVTLFFKVQMIQKHPHS